MSRNPLDKLFNPASIAVVGASEREASLGGSVLKNLLNDQYPGHLYVVNRRGYPKVYGVAAYTYVQHLPQTPELALITTPPETIPRLLRQLARVGVTVAVILTSGVHTSLSRSGRSLSDVVREISKQVGIRVVGPGSLGVIAPSYQLNASYVHQRMPSGKIAVVTQSAILGAAMVDWANSRGLGFSHLITLGDGVDIGMAEVLNFLAADTQSQAILLHLPYVEQARQFISAVRAASRHKIVLAIKSGRVVESQLQPVPETPGVKQQDAVYDEVLRRAGALRVADTDELFAALETLTRIKTAKGQRLAVIGNSMGLNAMATDALIRKGGALARFAESTQQGVAALLPYPWSGSNPIDLQVDADPERYRQVLQYIAQDSGVDAVLVLHGPTLTAPGFEVAEAVVEGQRAYPCNLLTSWIGQSSAEMARQVFNNADIPTYSTPDEAVNAFMHRVRYHRTQALLKQTPTSVQANLSPDKSVMREIVAQAQQHGQQQLRPQDARQILLAYGIPLAETCFAARAEGVVTLAQQLGYPVAVKLCHEGNNQPFYYSQSQARPWSGIMRDLDNDEAVLKATEQLSAYAKQHWRQYRPLGFSVQSMQRSHAALPLNLAVTRDPVFGALILFGSGGPVVNILNDRQVALPPLNSVLAEYVIKRSYVSRVLQELAATHGLDVSLVVQTLVKLSQLVVDMPELVALEINPLLLNERGIAALDVTMQIGSPQSLAIRPYPEELIEVKQLHLSGRLVEIRPIRAEDEPAHLEFAQRLSPETVRYRFFYPKKSISHQELAVLTQIDYDREMAFIATTVNQTLAETLGVVRIWTDADNQRSEFAVIVRDDQKGERLGYILMEKIIRYCRQRQTAEIFGKVLPDNRPMLRLAERLGFKSRYLVGEDVIEISLALHD